MPACSNNRTDFRPLSGLPMPRSILACVLIVVGAAWAGCGAPEAKFHLDRGYLQKNYKPPEKPEEPEEKEGEEEAYEREWKAYQEDLKSFEPRVEGYERQIQNLADVMLSLFGTPDEP